MSWSIRVALILAVCSILLRPAAGQQPRVKPQVELRWVEGQPIEGVTEEKGFQSSCDPDDIVYAHKKPALVLTAAEVAEVKLTSHDFKSSGLGENHMVALHLTPKARETLAAACPDGMRIVTVMVDGKPWGVHRYEKGGDQTLVPEQARAESFTPSVGFFSSKAEAERLVSAFK